jgi:hypothetical protein
MSRTGLRGEFCSGAGGKLFRERSRVRQATSAFGTRRGQGSGRERVSIDSADLLGFDAVCDDALQLWEFPSSLR